MFTGIISHLGTIKEKSESDLTIATDENLMKKLTLGASVAINGICLTVVAFDDKIFTIDFMPETAKKTTIHYLKAQDAVNLELPATPETFLAGHIVQGHVDAVGKITQIENEGNSRIITISFPEDLNKYIVNKGSIAMNGISLTVISVENNQFTVGIIPHSWEHTMLHTSKKGDSVNLEVDILAKYIEKLRKSK
jgi:riboflavin synthase